MAASNESAIPWRVGVLEREIETKADKEVVDALAEDLRGLRKAVIGAALAVMGSAILVSMTLLITVGSHVAGA